MVKMTVVAAVLAVALLAIVEASGFRASITTTADEEIVGQGQWGGQSQQRCRQQVQQRQQQLRQCQQFLYQQSQQGSPYDMRMYINSHHQHEQQQQQQLRQCCQQLSNFDEQCRCEAVKQIVQQVLEQQVQYEGQGQQGQRQQERLLQQARYLPRTCNLQPQECQIQQQPYLY